MMNDYAEAHTQPESPLVQDLLKATITGLRYDDLVSGRITAGLLRLLVRLSQAKRVLDIGMYTGYSALSMAEVLPDDGDVVTLETNSKYASIGAPFLQSDPHGKKIRVVMGPAMDTIPHLEGLFDLVFLDADKDRYPAYLELVKPLLRVGGVLVMDNAFWRGDVVEATSRKGASVHQANTMLLQDPDFENVFLPVRDGIHVAIKLTD